VANARQIAASATIAVVAAIEKREVGCDAGSDITPSDKLLERAPARDARASTV
jgi:hypothetical protein